jgi:hypothetical protein
MRRLFRMRRLQRQIHTKALILRRRRTRRLEARTTYPASLPRLDDNVPPPPLN